MESRILGWHFTVGETLGHGDGRSIVVGETLSVEGKIIPCKRGLHLSERALDALVYASGSWVWRVEGWGDAVSHGDPADKWAVRYRRALWGFDAERLLRRFARACSLDVAHLWSPLQIVLDYLTTGREDSRAAAREAAWAAARAAAREADAWDAAWDAAARDAAWEAAKEAVRGAARDAQNERLETWLHAHHEGTLDLDAPLELPARGEGK